MRKPIIGVTVGTPISSKRVEKDIKPVKTINNVNPDKNGNVELAPNNIGASPTSHTHTKSEITDFPTSMTPTAHTHEKSEITDFPTTEPWTFTLEDGSTVKKAMYAKTVRPVTIHIENMQSADDLDAATITHNGVTYNDAGIYTIEALEGDIILCNVNAAAGPPPTLNGEVLLNGSIVYSIAYDGGSEYGGTYSYVVTKEASIYLSNSQYMHYGWCGRIAITDE